MDLYWIEEKYFYLQLGFNSHRLGQRLTVLDVLQNLVI